MNGRLDALQAAVLRVKLRHLDDWNNARRRVAGRYESLFANSRAADQVMPPALPEGGEHVFHQYTIRVPKRDELMEQLRGKGVASAVYYPVPLHRQECFADLGYGEGSMPVSEKAAAETLALPIYPELTDEMQAYVVDVIADFFA